MASTSSTDPVPPPADRLTQASGDIRFCASSISSRLGQIVHFQAEMKAHMDRAATAVDSLGRGRDSSMPSEAILRIANGLAETMESLEAVIENFKSRHEEIRSSLAVVSDALGPCLQRAWEAEESPGGAGR
ncbi:hypothetical protein DL769_006847 [Monosporascus sp. CRB-8-3]|nr:hypothetical protein DL769_006847 [Monosporascus sp. CRB-8-3]